MHSKLQNSCKKASKTSYINGMILFFYKYHHQHHDIYKSFLLQTMFYFKQYSLPKLYLWQCYGVSHASYSIDFYIRTFFQYLKKSYNYKCIQQMNICFNKKENDMEYHCKLTSNE